MMHKDISGYFLRMEYVVNGQEQHQFSVYVDKKDIPELMVDKLKDYTALLWKHMQTQNHGTLE